MEPRRTFHLKILASYPNGRRAFEVHGKLTSKSSGPLSVRHETPSPNRTFSKKMFWSIFALLIVFGCLMLNDAALNLPLELLAVWVQILVNFFLL